MLDHRDPHLLGPPLRPDPQSYSALSDYLLPTPTLLCGTISAIVLMLFTRWFRTSPFDDAVSFLVLVQRVLVTADLPSWDLQLRSDPPSYALGVTTNYCFFFN